MTGSPPTRGGSERANYEVLVEGMYTPCNAGLHQGKLVGSLLRQDTVQSCVWFC